MDIDEQLKILIEQVCNAPEHSPIRQKALNRLLILVQRSPGLKTSSHPDYLDALNRTWEWFSKNIQTFRPRSPSVQASLMTWINGYLYWRIQDLYAPDSRAPESLDQAIGDDDKAISLLDKLSDSGLGPPTLSGLDRYIEQLQQQEHQRIGLAIEETILQDADGLLRNCHPKAHPGCNCWVLSQRLRLKDPPDKFVTVTSELNVNYSVLVAHWKRKCLPLLQTMARRLGYRPDSSS